MPVVVTPEEECLSDLLSRLSDLSPLPATHEVERWLVASQVINKLLPHHYIPHLLLGQGGGGRDSVQGITHLEEDERGGETYQVETTIGAENLLSWGICWV